MLERNMLKKIDKRFLFVLFILLLGLVIALYLVRQGQDIRKRAAETPVDLSLFYSGDPIVPGDAFIVPVSIASGTYDVTAGELYFNYNPDDNVTLTNVEVINEASGGKLPVILSDWTDDGSGNVSIILGTPCTNLNYCQTIIPGDTGTVLNLHFLTGLDFTQTQINIDQNQTRVAAIGVSGETLKQFSTASVLVSKPTPTPVPTNTPVPTPTPTIDPTIPVCGDDICQVNEAVPCPKGTECVWVGSCPSDCKINYPCVVGALCNKIYLFCDSSKDPDPEFGVCYIPPELLESTGITDPTTTPPLGER